MLAVSMAGFITGQSFSGDFVTVMKSLPRNTPFTPSILKSSPASGEALASDASAMSSVPERITSQLGRNFIVAGFGVSSVWMNMAVSVFSLSSLCTV